MGNSVNNKKQTQTISILEKIEGKVYKALEFMLAGIESARNRADFKIDMGTFGNSVRLTDNSRMCYGCAATCTIQQIANKEFKGKEIVWCVDRADYLGFNKNELDRFEEAIDSVRMADFQEIIDFCYTADKGFDYTLKILDQIKNFILDKQIGDDLFMCSDITSYPEEFDRKLANFKIIAQYLKEQNI